MLLTDSMLMSTPFRFGYVEKDVFRGAYPQPRNFRWLLRLNLRTILHLTPQPPTEDLYAFCQQHHIQSVHVPVPKPKENVPLTQQQAVQCLSLILNPVNLPVFVHCLDGSNVTGVLIMCLRKFQLWSHQMIYTEFSRYTRQDVPLPEEVDFIERFGNTGNGGGGSSTGAESAHVGRLMEATNLALIPPVSGDAAELVLSHLTASATVSSSNDALLAVDFPVEVPEWLFEGELPFGFLRSISISQISPSNNASALPASYTCTVSYAHPCVRTRLPIEHIQLLVSTAIQNTLPTLFAFLPGSSTLGSPLASTVASPRATFSIVSGSASASVINSPSLTTVALGTPTLPASTSLQTNTSGVTAATAGPTSTVTKVIYTYPLTTSSLARGGRGPKSDFFSPPTTPSMLSLVQQPIASHSQRLVGPSLSTGSNPLSSSANVGTSSSSAVAGTSGVSGIMSGLGSRSTSSTGRILQTVTTTSLSTTTGAIPTGVDRDIPIDSDPSNAMAMGNSSLATTTTLGPDEMFLYGLESGVERIGVDGEDGDGDALGDDSLIFGNEVSELVRALQLEGYGK